MKIYLPIILFCLFTYSCSETCIEDRQNQISYSFNILSPKNFKDDFIIDTYTKLEGINPDTGNKDFYSDSYKWITPYRDSISKGDTIYKKKGVDYFLI